MLTEHKEGSVTLGEKRHLVCVEVGWELDVLAELLPTVTTNCTTEATRSGYKVRCIASRLKALAEILTVGLGDSIATTDDLERQLRVTG